MTYHIFLLPEDLLYFLLDMSAGNEFLWFWFVWEKNLYFSLIFEGQFHWMQNSILVITFLQFKDFIHSLLAYMVLDEKSAVFLFLNFYT